MLNDTHVCSYMLHLDIFTTGNFGVVYKAYYTREGVQTKVAIKTLKGDYQ